jgi:ribosome biogenesis protein Nip4
VKIISRERSEDMLSSLKLLDLMSNSSEAIAKLWAKDVVKNSRTPFYHAMDEEAIIPQAAEFYRKLSGVYTLKDPYPAIKTFMEKIAEDRFREGVPLHEALYAIVLMRRHIWLYAEFQAIFVTIIEQHQALDSQTRTILMFDYIAYALTEKYMSLLMATCKKK